MGFDELQKSIVVSVLLPALGSGILLLLAAWASRGDTRPKLAEAGPPLAFAVAFVLGFPHVNGTWPKLPPPEALDWLVPFALAAAALGIIETFWRPPARFRLPLHALLIVGAFFLSVGRIARGEGTWGPTKGVIVLGSLGIGAWLFWALLEKLAERLEGASVPLVLVLVATGESVVLLEGRAGSKLARLAGVVAASLGAAVPIAWWRPKLGFARGVAVPAVVLPCIAVMGYVLASSPEDLSRSSFALLALAPLAAFVDRLKLFEKRKPWQVTLARTAAVMVPVAVAIAIAVATAPPPDEGY